MRGRQPNPIAPLVYPQVASLRPYQPGQAPAAGGIKLASNENPLGCGALAQAALRAVSAEQISRYPDGDAAALKAELAAHTGCDAKQIVVANGSNEILELAARLVLRPGLEAVFSQFCFIVYPLAAAACGAFGRQIPAADYAHDLQRMAAACQSESARVVFVANPNNPTGSWHGERAVYDFLRAIPRRVLIVLDEAYYEYAGGEFDAVQFLEEFPNLLITRTFSKIHGLAGLRVGYGLSCPELAELLNRIRQPFNANALAQAAACAALADGEFVAASQTNNAAQMTRLQNAFSDAGLAVMPSRANFLTFHIGKNAADIAAALAAGGVSVRPLANYDLPEWLRVTIGTEAQNEKFLRLLADARAAAR